jgi:hypothetical protein
MSCTGLRRAEVSVGIYSVQVLRRDCTADALDVHRIDGGLFNAICLGNQTSIDLIPP